MWFYPAKYDLEPCVEQEAVEKRDRTDNILPLVSNRDENTLSIAADARVFSSFLRGGKTEHYDLETGRGAYLYVLEGGPVIVNNIRVPALGSAMITEERAIDLAAEQDVELLLVEVKI
jgi:redox-sensitive bicupin YhaK (pirin superfamily)